MKSTYILILFFIFINANKNKGQSKFDKHWKDCTGSDECKNRPNDDACVYSCISDICYKEVFGTEYFIEYGEVNFDLKSKFESCYNYNVRDKKSV
jgi:hypothetical protein